MKLYKRIFITFCLLLFSFILIACNRQTEIDEIKDKLTYELILNNNESSNKITTNLNLPLKLEEALIEWKSSNGNVIKINGEVIRQSNDVSVRLIATITLGVKTDTKAFDLVVIAEEEDLTESFTVTFDTDGGGVIDPITVVKGEMLTRPKEPTKAGYKFIEWHLDGLSFDFNTEITQDIKLVAIWEYLDGNYSYFLIKTLTDAGGGNSYSGNKTIKDEQGTTYHTTDTYRVSVQSTAWMPQSAFIFAPQKDTPATLTINPKITFNQITLDAGLWNDAAGTFGLTFRVEVLINDNWDVIGENIYKDIPSGEYQTFTYAFNSDATAFRITVEGANAPTNNTARIAVDNIKLYEYGIDPNVNNPIISLDQDLEELIFVPAGSEFIIPTATAKDYKGNDITSLIETDHDNIDVNIINLYELNWIVTDDEGNTSKLTIIVNVFEKVIPSDPSQYYEDINLEEPLKPQLTTLVNDTNVNFSYDEARVILEHSDRDPANPNNVLLVYTRDSVKGPWTSGSEVWTREHVWPQSLLNNDTQTSDAHNLRPINQSVNEVRGNKKFVNGSGEAGVVGNDWYPGDDDRGDVARIIFYMATKYTELAINLIGNLTKFLEWHTIDPVDDFERIRNDVIYSYQDNRNPYIDNPEWVELVFGDNVISYDETILLANIIIYELNMSDLYIKERYDRLIA